ncbi:beta-lactamase class D [Verrucomicrobium sp. GAS474]|uniref:penicillin-binding transpeptidase domain-containing protein n=1 Tax=Verrucomicrobium sp. GAS474 TaxID=1882831 RepID=UPI00087CB1DF|nr:penicillin-binding transpeptidase domain-containing protein [Verrucomicrobium sp. GAS474]SDT89848.1 beta-lactamase class D [Verrucomicrobium sp. GAS474]
MLLSLVCAAALASPFSPATPFSVDNGFAGREGAFVLIDCATGETLRHDPAACARKLPPCSTFKIWNSIIGLEEGIITEADAPFWRWDGVPRSNEAWNQDQTVRSAFALSCVPAYQHLARKIGKERMAAWLAKIGYGDQDMSSGLDQFWLPKAGVKPLFISADEQAARMADVVTGRLPLKEHTRRVLAQIMTVKANFYGKTGSTVQGYQGTKALGWFVGYVESGGKTYAFACMLRGEGVLGTDAREVTERILRENGLL